MLDVPLAGGFNYPLATDLEDTLGTLEGATVKGALVAEGGTWPPADDAAWLACTVDATAGQAVVSQVIPSGHALGHFHWWLWVVSGSLSVLLRVRDPEDPDQPWHIWVH